MPPSAGGRATSARRRRNTVRRVIGTAGRGARRDGVRPRGAAVSVYCGRVRAVFVGGAAAAPVGGAGRGTHLTCTGRRGVAGRSSLSVEALRAGSAFSSVSQAVAHSGPCSGGTRTTIMSQMTKPCHTPGDIFNAQINAKSQRPARISCEKALVLQTPIETITPITTLPRKHA